MTGTALIALGSGFVFLAIASSRFTDQPQSWALIPGVVVAVAGLAIGLSPSGHTLALAGWVWPLLLLVLVLWSVRGARGELHNWSGVPFSIPPSSYSCSSRPAVRMRRSRRNLLEPTARRAHLPCQWPPPLPELRRSWSADRCPLQRAGRTHPELGLGAADCPSSTRVCSYDWTGEGWSSGTPSAQDGRQLSSDLHGLLAVAHVPGPYVIAGHSVGGIYALLYAAHYLKQVAGVALIDSSTPYQFDLPDYPNSYRLLRRAAAVFPSLARAGLVRLSTSTGNAGLPPQARNAARAFAASPRELRADHVEVEQLPGLFNETKAFKSLGGKPLAVVTATLGQQRGWAAAQDELAKLSTNSVHRTVPGATHETLLEDERFAKIASRAIAQVVQSARSGQR